MLTFTITRCIQSKDQEGMWIECCRRIKEHHPYAQIVVLDDHSTIECTTIPNVITASVPSRLKGRGELLPLWWLLTSDNATSTETMVFVHDSMFLCAPIPSDVLATRDVTFLWSFGGLDPTWKLDQNHLSLHHALLATLPLSETLQTIQDQPAWKGCFGGMCVIRREFAKRLQERHNLLSLSTHISTRPARCVYERLFALACHETANVSTVSDVYGDIHAHHKSFRYTFADFQRDSTNGILPKHIVTMPAKALKVWSGR